MIETVTMALIMLWLAGMIAGVTLGGFIWVLFIAAITLVIVRLVMR